MGNNDKLAPKSWTFDAAKALLRGYQLKWIATSRLTHGDIAHMGGRQIGKDFTWSFDDAESMVTEPRTMHNIISATESHSADYMRDVGIAIEYLSTVAKSQGRPFPKVVQSSSKSITLDNGSMARSFAPVPRSVVGRRGNITLNEIGIMPNAKEIFEAAEPVVRAQRSMGRRAHMRIISNASVTGTFLHEFWEGPASNGFVKIISPWEEVMRSWLIDLGNPLDSVDQFIDAQKKGIIETIGPAGFAQWYCCKWRPRNEVFFQPELLSHALYNPGVEGAPDLSYEGNHQVLGIDIGRHNNPTVITPLILWGERRWSVKSRQLHKMPYAQQMDEIGDMVESRKTLRGFIDRTGMGDAPAEEAMTRWPSVMVGINLSAQALWSIWSTLRSDLENDILRIDSRDVDLFMELSSIEATRNDTGKVKIHLGSTVDATYGTMRHGDVAMAFALSNYAASSPGVGRPRPRKLNRTWREVPAGKMLKHSWNRHPKKRLF